ncbi:MAG: acylphosphatase [Verrucomicrobiales bacterium]|nr:acylphosphatase [Verrucomicrobiales bacterium]
MVAKQIFYTGRVQGVGFRFSVKQLAKGFEVQGWAKNMADGRVELQLMGEQAEVEEFIEEIAESHLAGFIRETEQQDISLLANCVGFSIS